LDATPSDDEPHGDPFNDENITKKLRILKKLEEEKDKATDKESALQIDEMKQILTNHEQDMEKCIATHLDEQTRTHDEELNVIKQSQLEINNLSINVLAKHHKLSPVAKPSRN
jgi:hypothetical protein